MNKADLIRDIIATYERHGWKLKRVLLRPDTKESLVNSLELFPGAAITEADLDALWFARPSHGKREAWELRLIAETPYALFEAFDADETEEERDEARREMENRMRESATSV